MNTGSARSIERKSPTNAVNALPSSQTAINKSLFNKSSKLIQGGARLSNVRLSHSVHRSSTHDSFMDISLAPSEVEMSVMLDGASAPRPITWWEWKELWLLFLPPL